MQARGRHAISSLAEKRRRRDGIALDIKTLRCLSSARARAAQQSAACGRWTAQRVVVSLDGGRVRVRRKKRGRRDSMLEGTEAPHFVVGDDGRPSGGTGTGGVFALLLSYARQIGLNAADKVLFIADGAPGNASSASSPRSGSRRHRCWG